LPTWRRPTARWTSRAILAVLFCAGAIASQDGGVRAQGPEAAPAPAPSPSPGFDERLARVRQRRELLSRELERLRGQERSLLGEVEALELEVRLRSAELEAARIDLQRSQAELNRTLARVTELEHDVAVMRPVLAAHARRLYKLGELSYLRLLLSVERPSDVFRGYGLVTSLARRDVARMSAFRADLQSLSTQRSELERRTRETVASRGQLEKARASLDRDRRRKTELLTSLVERKEIHAAFVAELEGAESRLRDLLQGLGTGDASVPMAVFRGSLPWPVAGKIRSGFGRKKHPKFDTYTLQNGIEIDAPEGTAVAAVHEGQVAFAERFKGYGLMVAVDHGGRHHTIYAHLAETTVAVGDHVTAGQTLGTSGPIDDDVAGVYFEVRFQGRPEDPADWLGKAPR
jgi:septal ring factor EnvC (AmiA/AmiB activator)